MTRGADLPQALQLRHPIIQAPMAGVSTPALAAAVSNAGGLGSIALGAAGVDAAREAIAATRALTARPFNVNLFCHAPAQKDAHRESDWLAHLSAWFAELCTLPPAALSEPYRSFIGHEAMLQLLLDERPAVVSFHFGLPPAQWVARLKAAGCITLACVTSLEEALWAGQAGIDALVAQGQEAGGHRGCFDPAADRLLGTLPLLALLRASTSLPLIAAGGIMDGRGIAAALALGACAAQMGTAFILCPESAADTAYREALASERSRDTAISAAISGRPARGMRNRLFTEVDAPCRPRLPDYPIAYDAAKALVAAAKARGIQDFSVQWAGQGAPLARALPAAELLAQLQSELDAVAGSPA